MIRYNPENIKRGSLAFLKLKTNAINRVADFEGKVNSAKTAWKNKTGSNSARAAFDDVKKKLKDVCSGEQICSYCEHNEATDIEHIYPKRLFPGKAFNWNNYLFVCGICNTHYKSDNFAVFVNVNNIEVVLDITPQRDVYAQPPNSDAVFIDQRIEDPMYFLELDFSGMQFVFIERNAANTREYLKARYTIETLGLNKRADLIRQRKAAFAWYIGKLKIYVLINNSLNFSDLLNALQSEPYTIDNAGDFANEKVNVLALIKKDINEHSHPTVWKEIIRQRNQLTDVNLLLNQAIGLLVE